jgi:F-type H+-transporting ATPase subunit gamma
MPSLKEVRNRITSVNSTQQITKAMKMVAAAKLRRAQDATLRLRPYANKMMELLSTVSAHAEVAQSHPYKIVRPVEKVLIIVVTSDRGLCGAFNANVAKAAVALINDKYPQAKEAVTILPIGKKGAEFFQRRGYNVIEQHINTYQNLSFVTVRAAAEQAMEGFVDGQWDAVEVIYNQFKNVATQIITAEQMLPIPAAEVVATETKTSNVDYIFEPSEEEIIFDLIPKTLKLQLYKAVLESNASEHGARMTAMDKATDNAGELLKELKLIYNRSRQAAITKEILEIVGGAEALAAQ